MPATIVLSTVGPGSRLFEYSPPPNAALFRVTVELVTVWTSVGELTNAKLIPPPVVKPVVLVVPPVAVPPTDWLPEIVVSRIVAAART